jgi:hypothetical protein
MKSIEDAWAVSRMATRPWTRRVLLVEIRRLSPWVCRPVVGMVNDPLALERASPSPVNCPGYPV